MVMEKARWAIGVFYALLGILGLIGGVLGTGNRLDLGIGVLWLLGGILWPVGIITQRRRQRAAAIKAEERG
jgi:hypothetical protein